MSHNQMDGDLGVDANGCLTEHVVLGELDVVVHYEDIPESDITTVDGIPCTTALRTVIDLAAQLDGAELKQMVLQCLSRGLFTVEAALRRVAEPDMRTHPGAQLVRQAVRSFGEAGRDRAR